MDATPLLKGTRSRWLVTGAAGFIGSHLVETLAMAGQDVVAVDNFATGRRDTIDAVSAALANRGVDMRFVEGDICDPALMGRAIRGVDYVLHQAAVGSGLQSIDEPMRGFAANVHGFTQVLDAARNEQVRSFVYASSRDVYDDHAALPRREDQTGRMRTPFAAAKSINELLAGIYSRCYGMRTIGLRYFNVFGARQDPDGPHAAVIPRWASSMLRGERVYIHGDGRSSRDFCFVDNVVQANIRAALCTSVDRDSVFNVGVGYPLSLIELFRLLKELLQEYEPFIANIEPIFRDPRADKIPHSFACIDKARRLIGYEPTHTPEDGLRACIGWYVGTESKKAPRQVEEPVAPTNRAA